MAKVDPEMNMAHLIRETPALGRILQGRGIDCADCLASQVDTLRDVARMYTLDLEALLLEVESLNVSEPSHKRV